MEETNESLEAQRKALYQKLEELGDFRRGTLDGTEVPVENQSSSLALDIC